jgi:hypothetical protein
MSSQEPTKVASAKANQMECTVSKLITKIDASQAFIVINAKR